MKGSGAAEEQRTGSPVDAKLISLIAGAIAVLAPIIINLTLTSFNLSIRAMSWWIEFEAHRAVIDYSLGLWLSTLPLTARQLIFV